jgi:hypothetical protein
MAEGKPKRSGYEVSLKVNGKDIPLNLYVRSVFVGVVTGLVSTLKDTPEPEKVEIMLRKG